MTKLGVADVSAIATGVIEVVDDSDVQEVKETPLYSNIVSEQVVFKESLARLRKSDSTEAKVVADKKRDGSFIGVRKYFDSLTYSPVEGVCEKATKLYGIVNMYGSGVESFPDSKESEYLSIIIAKLMEPANFQMVTEVGGKEYLEKLVKDEKEFMANWGDQEADKHAFRNSKSATQSRRKLESAINVFYGYLVYSASYAPANRDKFAKLQSAIYSRYLSIKQKYNETKTDEES